MITAIIEIGSTITKLNVFDISKCKYIGKGIALTTVLEGDVQIGIDNAIKDFEKKFPKTEFNEILACSSAAGGLKMTVHGLTKNMTARAAKEASLGAGAVLHYLTTGIIREYSAEKIVSINPNIILLAGGVNGGDSYTTLKNAKILSELNIYCPVIFAGNSDIANEVKNIFLLNNKKIYITDNVYPDVDELNIEPARKIIQQVFSEHILHAPGMEKISSICKRSIFPVPAMVLKAVEIISDIFDENIVAIDVGGATTDIHSVCKKVSKYDKLSTEPEPEIKRTVEGDLGVYINAKRIIELSNKNLTEKELATLKALPKKEIEKKFTYKLAEKAVSIGIKRHAGIIKEYFSASGKVRIIKGKDLTEVKYIIGTGGPLSQLEKSKKILENIRVDKITDSLLPISSAKIKIDKNYLMSSIGVLSCFYKKEAKSLAKKYILDEN